VNEVLENENRDYRPADKEERPGGLVLLRQDLPTIIVPDLHGRSDYFPDLMRFRNNTIPIRDLLQSGKIQLVCVGDGMHSEKRGIARWRVALQEYKNGFKECPAMAEEMNENFQTMAMVMRLKIAFPDLFHFLKGNHENIMDEEINGNHPFAKLAAEGPMTRKYVEQFYGNEFLERFNRFEKNLPLMARGRFFLISHSRPKAYYPIDDIINYRSHPDLIEGLTWTRHNTAKTGVIRQMLSDILGNGLNQKLWISGHSAISDLYHYWNDEYLLEIHNPGLRLVVVIDPNQPFDPERHIHILPKQSSQNPLSHG
jgi:hypothetical protein